MGYYLKTPKDIKYAQHDFINRCGLLPKDLCDQSINQIASALKIDIPLTLKPESAPASIKSILEYAKKGISFANHTSSHRVLSSDNASLVCADIENAKSFLNKHKLETKTFAYPIGKLRSIEDNLEIVSASGFDIAFTAIKGLAESNQNRFIIPRIHYLQDINSLSSICSPVLEKYSLTHSKLAHLHLH